MNGLYGDSKVLFKACKHCYTNIPVSTILRHVTPPVTTNKCHDSLIPAAPKDDEAPDDKPARPTLFKSKEE